MKAADISSLVVLTLVIRSLTGTTTGYDQGKVQERLSGLAPQAEFSITKDTVRAQYHAEKQRVFPILKTGKKGTQQVLVDSVADDGWIVEVDFLGGPYNGQMLRPAVLDLTTLPSRGAGNSFRTAADGSFLVNVRLGEKADLTLVRRLYLALRNEISGLPKLSESQKKAQE